MAGNKLITNLCLPVRVRFCREMFSIRMRYKVFIE